MSEQSTASNLAPGNRESALEREIRVKDALIHEVHHRVKNNIQTVESLLRLHIRCCPPGDARDVLFEAAVRLRSMAVVHEMLSDATKERVDVVELARRVTDQVKTGMCGGSDAFRIDVVGEPRFAPSSVAMSLALVIAEITCNSFEHGFAGKTHGLIDIRFEETERGLKVTISDDGCGLPSDFDLQKQSSMGLTLMRTLIEDDLRSRLDVVPTQAGACFSFMVPACIFDKPTSATISQEAEE